MDTRTDTKKESSSHNIRHCQPCIQNTSGDVSADSTLDILLLKYHSILTQNTPCFSGYYQITMSGLGPQCCENPPNFGSGGGEEGRIEEIGGLKSYTSGSPGYKLAVLLISDVMGYEAPKLRQLADKVSASGFYVVVPDFFNGDPFVPENTERPIYSWLNDHQPDKGCEDARKIVADLKSKGTSAVGVAGFCWGGMVVSKMSKYDEIQAGVILHPGPLLEDDINAMKVPTAIIGAELDDISPPEKLKNFREILSANSVDNFVKIYPGVVHGWTVRYADEDAHAVKCAMEAHEDILNWFNKYIK